MVFKAIQDKFKVKSAKKFLEDALLKQKSAHDKKGVATVACIVDMDNYGQAETFKSLKDNLGLRPNAVQVIGYKRGKDQNGMFGIPYCTDKNLGWNGSIENGDFSEFIGRPYDVLINYFTDDRLLLKLMSVQVDARIRIGVKDGNKNLSDLTIETNLNDFETFKKELKKYLKILEELKP